MKMKILGLLAVALVGGPAAAHAFTFAPTGSWDTTVVRPTSGILTLDFFGTLTLDDGERVSCLLAIPYRDSTEKLSAIVPNSCVSLVGNALRFQVFVSADDALGLYNKNISGDAAALLITNAQGSRSPYSYSVNVVDRLPVPEPGTLALLGLGLAGLGLSRRRKAN